MTYEIRALSFSEILDTGFRLTRNHFRLLGGIAGLIYLPASLISAYWESLLQSPATGDLDGLMTMGIALLGGGALYAVAVWPLVMTSVTYAVGELYCGRPVGIGTALREGWRLMPAVLGTGLIVMLAVIAGFLLLIVPGIYLMLSFSVIGGVMVFERTFGTEAMRRSRELMRDNLLRGLGLLVVAGLVGGVLTAAAQITLGSLPYVGALATAAAGSAQMVFTSAINVVLYFDLRCRKEHFDLDHLAGVVAGGIQSGTPP